MKKIKLTLLILWISFFSFQSISSTSSLCSLNQWHNEHFLEAYWSIDMLWNEPVFGLSHSNAIRVPLTKFIDNLSGENISNSKQLYGQPIGTPNEVVDPIDYISRLIYCKTVFIHPSIHKAFEEARCLQKYPILLYNVQNHFQVSALNNLFLNPSSFSGATIDCTKEGLYIHCVYLANALLSNKPIDIINDDY